MFYKRTLSCNLQVWQIFTCSLLYLYFRSTHHAWQVVHLPQTLWKTCWCPLRSPDDPTAPGSLSAASLATPLWEARSGVARCSPFFGRLGFSAACRAAPGCTAAAVGRLAEGRTGWSGRTRSRSGNRGWSGAQEPSLALCQEQVRAKWLLAFFSIPLSWCG